MSGGPALPPLMPGTVVLDPAGITTGRVMHLFPDPVTTEPVWASVAPADGGEWVLVPLAGSVMVPTGVVVAHPAAVVFAGPPAPNRDVLVDEEVLAATAYYYNPTTQAAAAAPGSDAAATPVASVVVHDGDDDVVVVRSEEQLRTGTERVVAQRLRVRKVVVTEERTITVALRHEEYRIEALPLDEPPVPGQLGTPRDSTSSAAGSTPADSDDGGDDGGAEDELVLTLHAERPVITTEVLPVERIRISKHLVTGEQPVSAVVRREVVDGPHTAPPST